MFIFCAVWRYIGVSFDFLVGGSFFAWLHQHSIGHHLYTNVRGADPDLGILLLPLIWIFISLFSFWHKLVACYLLNFIGDGDMDFRRVSPAQTWRPIYKYQHFYAPMLYGFLTFKSRYSLYFILFINVLI